jgi:hypothetical protein
MKISIVVYTGYYYLLFANGSRLVHKVALALWESLTVSHACSHAAMYAITIDTHQHTATGKNIIGLEFGETGTCTFERELQAGAW